MRGSQPSAGDALPGGAGCSHSNLAFGVGMFSSVEENRPVAEIQIFSLKHLHLGTGFGAPSQLFTPDLALRLLIIITSTGTQSDFSQAIPTCREVSETTATATPGRPEREGLDSVLLTQETAEGSRSVPAGGAFASWKVPQGVEPSFSAFCSWMQDPVNCSLHHLRTQSLPPHSWPQLAFGTYCPHLFIFAV